MLSYVAAICLSAFIELGIGYDRHIDEGSNPMSTIRLSCEFAPNWYVEYDHHSSITDGFPFNNKKEDLADTISIIRRWEF